jgi:hypothetical protein
MPGTTFIVDRVVDDPVKPPAQPGAEQKENLGQVIHLKRVNIWELEVKHRQLSAIMAGNPDLSSLIEEVQGRKVLKSGDLTLADGEQVVDPVSGNFYRIDLATQELQFVSNKNYFLGTDLEKSPDELGRTRHPYTSEKSTRGVRDEINAMLLTGDSAVPFLNDMTKNVAYEIDKRKAGYYDESSPMHAYKKADDAVLEGVKSKAASAVAALQPLTMEKKLPAAAIAPGKPFPGQLLAELASSALRQPLRMIAVDASGRVQTEPGTDGEPQALKLGDINKTFDKVDLAWEKQGHAMIGVGPHGYYTLAYKDGKLAATPVRISAQGHTAGNLLHAIAASALPNPGASRYVEKDGVLKTATEDRLKTSAAMLTGMPGAYPAEPEFDLSVDQDVAELLGQIKAYAGADYVPMQKWLGERHAALTAAAAMPDDAPESGGGKDKQAAIRSDRPGQSGLASGMSIQQRMMSSSSGGAGTVTKIV